MMMGSVFGRKEVEPADASGISEHVVPSPIFDIGKAVKVKHLVDKIAVITEFKALNLALALASYNFSVVNNPSYFVLRRFILQTQLKLLPLEQKLWDSQSPLPTIGIEVESPRKPFNLRRLENYLEYSNFFDLIGMPRNKVNGASYTAESPPGYEIFWEFSPPPSYSAVVQKRILFELINGRFIPSLKDSKRTEDIKEFLDEKLVSLHINLGIPDWLRQTQDTSGAERSQDIELLAASFAFGFTSASRLLHRNQSTVSGSKSAIPTNKDQNLGGRRVEIKAFEVRDGSVYRLIEEIQLLSASAFSFLGKGDQALSQTWVSTKDDLLLIFEKFNIEPGVLSDKARSSELVGKTEIAALVRKVITKKALLIRQLLNPT